MEQADVILDTLYKTLVTPPAIRYRRAHVDARRGFRGGPDASRGGGRSLVAADGGAGARGGAAPGGDGCPFPCGFPEVAVRQEPEQTEGGRRGDEGSPPRGEERAVLPGGSGAAGEAPFASRRRVEQAQHDHVAAHGSLPVARSLAGVAGPEGYDRPFVWREGQAAQGRADAEDRQGHGRAAVERERPAAQGAGALAGAEGRARGVAQEGRGASQVETSGTGFAAPGGAPGCARRWNGRGSRRTRSRRCAGKSVP